VQYEYSTIITWYEDHIPGSLHALQRLLILGQGRVVLCDPFCRGDVGVDGGGRREDKPSTEAVCAHVPSGAVPVDGRACADGADEELVHSIAQVVLVGPVVLEEGRPPCVAINQPLFFTLLALFCALCLRRCHPPPAAG
jgi:hypothetical protein